MAFVDRVSQYPGRIRLTNVDTGEELGTFDVDRDEGVVSEPGTPLSAANLNTEIENTVAEAVDSLTAVQQFNVFSQQTIPAGGTVAQTSVDISRAGYTPFAVRGIDITNNACYAYYWHITGNTLVVSVKNAGTSSVTCSCSAYIAYIKDI